MIKPYLSVDNQKGKDIGLKIQGLRKVYKSRLALMDFSIFVTRGEVVSLLGPNGAGKTTAFNIIAGIHRSDGGSIKLDGDEISNLPMYRRSKAGLGYLPQESSIFKGLNVEKNIDAILELKIRDPKERKKKLEQLLGEFSITHLRNARAVNLSGGERRRVEIARSLIHKPKLLLLDEPTVGLDIGSRQLILEHVKNLCKKEKLAVLWATHLIDEIDKGEKVIIINKGKVLISGDVDKIINKARVKTIRDAFNKLVKI